jgi:hypothetical protein
MIEWKRRDKMFGNLRPVKKGLIVCGLWAILLLASNGWCQQETYTFDVPVIDKIIVEAEQCKSLSANLIRCNDMVGLCQQETKLNDARLVTCETSSKELSAIIKNQQSTIEDVNKLIEAEKAKAAKEKFWLRIEWGAYGTVFGAILMGILMAL